MNSIYFINNIAFSTNTGTFGTKEFLESNSLVAKLLSLSYNASYPYYYYYYYYYYYEIILQQR
jgi:hypothetical protein